MGDSLVEATPPCVQRSGRSMKTYDDGAHGTTRDGRRNASLCGRQPRGFAGKGAT
jgi:hypothetical protein